MFTIKNTLIEFQKFYKDLENKENIFYMFFTTGLLFWVKKSYSLIPKEVNIVCIGAGLNEDEKKWLHENIDRPVFYINDYCDDKDIWELLFSVNEKNFGWLDIDCFVFNPEIFKEISTIDDNIAINSIWSNKYTNCVNDDITFINTYFLFVNIEVIKKIRNMGLAISPRVYVYDKSEDIRFTVPAVLNKEQADIMQHYFPSKNYPSFWITKSGFHAFDTLLVYQMIAHHFGYRLNKVRNLDYNNYFSHEILHVGGSSNFSLPQFEIRPEIEMKNEDLYFIISYIVLSQTVPYLPKEYKIMEKMTLKLLISTGINKTDIKTIVSKYITSNHVKVELVDKLFQLKLN